MFDKEYFGWRSEAAREILHVKYVSEINNTACPLDFALVLS